MALFTAAEELPFPYARQRLEESQLLLVVLGYLTALLDFVNELLRTVTVDEVTVLGDHVSDGCFQVASEDLGESLKVTHGGCPG
jgi:hypothetical protein